MVQEMNFNGSGTSDPHRHIETFLEACDLFKMKGISDNIVRLRLFPFTLTEGAKDWFRSLAPNSIRTWEELKSIFMVRYFLLAKVNMLKNDMLSFKQGTESLTTAWERFNGLLLILPNHGFTQEEVTKIFYKGLTDDSRLMLDTSNMEGHDMSEVNDITTRGGKVDQSPQMSESNSVPNSQVVEPEIELPATHSELSQEKITEPKERKPRQTQPKVPFLVRLRKEKRRSPVQ
ncbi:hypothetical protein OSB04_019533 [Centaurea solstitialis]|uniref:Retrotransposon gag domain-containing protein n=1 Tax=Centaurea solstitialis TaxID=347529 RepID=A0AA38SQI2_9ASTR|nr:hypothetical protein OSB04_019533 [Centaurea solstitialis]